MKKTHRFSLSELVLIAAVFFVGAAMVVSAATEMTAAEKNVNCQANLKKFAAAMTQYSQDNGGWLLFPGLAWNEPQGLGKLMDAYVSNQMPSKNTGVFGCPADDRAMADLQEGGAKFWAQNPDGKWEYFRVSYAVNLIATGMPNNPHWKPHKLSAMEYPGQCYIFSDALLRDNPGDVKRFAFRHDGKANTAFADGSVKDLDNTQTPDWLSHRNQGFWVGGAE